MENYLFEKEIRVFGMRRSGNAAVNNFIAWDKVKVIECHLYNKLEVIKAN